MRQTKLKISNSQGITLIEIVVVIFITVLFFLILISDFPKIQRQFALSRVAYELAQDLRKTQDLGLSGVQLIDKNGQPISIKGYGVYVNLVAQFKTQYIIYADVNGDQKYSSDLTFPLCDEADQTSGQLVSDCVIKIIDIKDSNNGGNPNLYIKQINNINNPSIGFTSINFSPPNPTIKIDNLNSGQSGIEIVLELSADASASRKVLVNTSGLINVQ